MRANFGEQGGFYNGMTVTGQSVPFRGKKRTKDKKKRVGTREKNV